MQQGSLSVRSPLIVKEILLYDRSQLPFLFSLCGVEGIGALPQVAGATDAVATSLVRHKCKEREGRYGANAAVQSSTATCGWKNCFIYFPLPLSPPPPPLGKC